MSNSGCAGQGDRMVMVGAKSSGGGSVASDSQDGCRERTGKWEPWRRQNSAPAERYGQAADAKRRLPCPLFSVVACWRRSLRYGASSAFDTHGQRATRDSCQASAHEHSRCRRPHRCRFALRRTQRGTTSVSSEPAFLHAVGGAGIALPVIPAHRPLRPPRACICRTR